MTTKKRVPKKIVKNPILHIMSGLKRIPYDMSIILKIRKHYALSCLKDGTLNKEHFQSLIEMVNMAIVLIEFHYKHDHLPDLFLARDTLKTIGLRFKATDKFTASDVELSHVNYAMAIHSIQLDELRVVDVENAYQEIDRRLRNGHNIVKIKEE